MEANQQPFGPVSVVLLNWNQPKKTLKALESILKSEGAKLRILLVDNGSSEANQKLLKKSVDDFFIANPQRETASLESFTWVHSDENLGYAGGCNLGISEAVQFNTAYTLILNNDITMDPNCISTLLRVGAVERRALVGARILDSSGKLDVFLGRRWPWMLLGLGKGRIEGMREIGEEQVLDSDYVEGSALLLSSDFIKIKIQTDGYCFDPHYFLYCEDADLCLWAKRHGYKSVLATQAKIFHDVGGSFQNDKFALRYYYLTRNRIRLANRWLKFWQKPIFHLLYLVSRVVLQIKTGRHSGATRKAVLEGLVHGYRSRGGKWDRH